ncbi:MAG TPA: PaaX family transcriptional regulator C-terminal domain-containing protein [Chthoniobacterales bacterium]|nr:PaaX family transcriptional regulator C-terminal domain-containing protein [Chthoniobacterales bacterium]
MSAVFPSISATRRAIQKWIQRVLANDPPRAKSLVVTIFGDSIQPYGGSIRLKGLIDLLAPFGINQRLVRTSVFRLVQEQWLQPKKYGRESSYQLTESGKRRFALAYGKIYRRQTAEWNGRWTLIVLPANGTTPQLRTRLRRELEWQGLRQLAPNLLAHPQIDRAALEEVLDRLDAGRKVAACQVVNSADLGSLSDLVKGLWDLSAVINGYREFLRRCSTLRRLSDEPDVIAPQQWFMIRTLLIHAFRRIVLHDPLLPIELLPDPWIGAQAYTFVSKIYWQSLSGSEAHLSAVLGSTPDEVKRAGMQLRKRFRRR